jgi:hypothetical protein
MPFKPKDTKNKVKSVYKTLYISEALAAQVEEIAKANNTSWNNVVVSMIEHCLSDGTL